MGLTIKDPTKGPKNITKNTKTSIIPKTFLNKLREITERNKNQII